MRSGAGVARLTAADVPEFGGRTESLDVLVKRRSSEKYEASPLTRLREVIQLIHVAVDCVEPSAHAPEIRRSRPRRHQPIQLRCQAVESRSELPEEPRRLSQVPGFPVRFDRFGQRAEGQADAHT